MNTETPSLRSFPRSALATLALAIVCAFSIPSAHADLILTAPIILVPVAAGSTGTFDITLRNTGPGASAPIGSFMFFISVSGASGVTFNGVSNGTTTAPYIFDGLGLSGSNIGTGAPGSANASASDMFSVIGSGTVLGAGATVGLGHVSFSIAAGAFSGVVPITFSLSGTKLFDTAFPTANSISYTAVNGSLTVLGASPPAGVPDGGGSSVVLLGLSLLGLWLGQRTWSRRGVAVA